MPCHLSMHLCTLSLRVFVLATLLAARRCGCIEAAARLGCQIGARAPVKRAWVAPRRRSHGFLMYGVWFDRSYFWPASLSVSDVLWASLRQIGPRDFSRLSMHAYTHAVRPRNSHSEPKPVVCVPLLFFVLPLNHLLFVACHRASHQRFPSVFRLLLCVPAVTSVGSINVLAQH
jgi:hypothetical protein